MKKKIIEKERGLQKLTYSIKPKIMWYGAIYNKKPNYIIEYRYYWELAGTLAGGFLKADHVLRNLKVSEILFQITAAKYFIEFLP